MKKVVMLAVALFAFALPVFALMECSEYLGGTMYWEPYRKHYICSGAGDGGGCTLCSDSIDVTAGP